MRNEVMDLFVKKLKAGGVTLSAVDYDRQVVSFGFNLENTSLTIFVVFGDDIRYVQIIGGEFARIPREKKNKAYEICNSLNEEYRWVKFYYNEDGGDLRCETDAIVDVKTSTDEINELWARMTTIVDKAYPKIMKSIF